MAVASEIRDHQALCASHLARLHVLGRYQAGEPVPPGLAEEISTVTSAILAETCAAVEVTVAAVRDTRRTSVAGFLAHRVARLAAAGDEAVGAARAGDAAVLHRRLHRFEVLASAVWTVQLAMPEKTIPSRPTRRPSAAPAPVTALPGAR